MDKPLHAAREAVLQVRRLARDIAARNAEFRAELQYALRDLTELSMRSLRRRRYGDK